jgi:hypothetical protein
MALLVESVLPTKVALEVTIFIGLMDAFCP